MRWMIVPLAMCGVAWSAHAAPTFKHIVIVFQENRTPDNLFGSSPHFEPGVDIASFGVTSKHRKVALAALPLDDCYDISHSHASFEYALHKGFDTEPLDSSTCTGKLPPADPHYMYVDNSTGTVQPYFDIATNYGFANRMFQTNQGPSFPAHQFIFGGTSAPQASTSLFASGKHGVRQQLARGQRRLHRALRPDRHGDRFARVRRRGTSPFHPVSSIPRWPT